MPQWEGEEHSLQGCRVCLRAVRADPPVVSTTDSGSFRCSRSGPCGLPYRPQQCWTKSEPGWWGPREGAQRPGSSGGLGARWRLQSPLPFSHICFPLQPREVGTTTFILDTKKQSLRGTQVLPGPDISEQEAWASGSLSPPFPESHPSCPAGPLGLSPLPLDHPRDGGEEWALSASHP